MFLQAWKKFSKNVKNSPKPNYRKLATLMQIAKATQTPLSRFKLIPRDIPHWMPAQAIQSPVCRLWESEVDPLRMA